MGRQKKLTRAEKAIAKANKKSDQGSNKNELSIDLTVQETNYDYPMPVGLKNLGNTCFFNSIVQCLCQTKVLKNVLEDEKQNVGTKRTIVTNNDSTIKSLEYEVPQMCGSLTNLLNFLNKFYEFKEERKTRTRAQKRAICPDALFDYISKKSKRFNTYEQDDCVALFDTLITLASDEDKKNQKSALLKKMNLKNENPKNVPEELKEEVKNYGAEIDTNYLSPMDRIFSGYYISHLRCDSCETVKRCEERFYVLSLPLTDRVQEKTQVQAKSNAAKNVQVESQSSERTESSAKSNRTLRKERQKSKREARYRKRHIQFSFPENAHQQDEKQEEDDSFCEGDMQKESDATIQNGLDKKEDENCKKSLSENKQEGSPCEEEITNGCSDETAQKLINSTKSLDAKSNGEVEGLSDFDKIESLENQFTTLNLISKDEELKSKKIESCHPLNGGQPFETKNKEELNDVDEEVNEDSVDDNKTSSLKLQTPVIKTSPLDNSWFVSPFRVSTKYLKEVRSKLPQTLGKRSEIDSDECSIINSLRIYTKPEALVGPNQTTCDFCTAEHNKNAGGDIVVKRNQQKQILIKCPPPVLVLQMKIFNLTSSSLKKLKKHVKLSLLIDLSSCCLSEAKKYANSDNQILYELIGVVVHQGTLNSGHYTCYVKRRSTPTNLSKLILGQQNTNDSMRKHPSEGQWYYISDDYVSPIAESKVLETNAYMTFYERLI